MSHRAHSIEFPGILIGEPERHVVWGLTYSFLESFFRAIRRPLPNRWTPQLHAYARGMHEPEARAQRAAGGCGSER